MSAEWQGRQLLFIASETGPFGYMASPGGRSMLTDFSEYLPPACASGGARVTPATRAIDNRVRDIAFSSGNQDHGTLDDVAHESARVPIRRVRLGFTHAVSAPDHQRII